MSTVTTWQTDSTSSAATEALAEKIGQALKGGEVIELASDLGGGKTTFVRGLARGFGSTDHVSSPTFTISKVYHSPRGVIHHFDFYRLPEAGLMSEEFADVLQDPQSVVVVEWAGIIKDALPERRLTITIEQTADGRTLHFAAPAQLRYLLEAVQ